METALGIAGKLGYNDEQTAQFCQLVQLSKAKSPELRETLVRSNAPTGASAGSQREFVPVSLEAFQAISDWYHYAILELIACENGKLTSKQVSDRLGISVEEARAAMNRLIRLDMLKSVGGRWQKTNAFIATPTDRPNRALRNFHSQMIEKAKAAIELQTVEERDISGITVPISEDKIALAKREIRNFRRRLAKLVESDKPTEVYQLNVQFFALSKPSKGKRGGTSS